MASNLINGLVKYGKATSAVFLICLSSSLVIGRSDVAGHKKENLVRLVDVYTPAHPQDKSYLSIVVVGRNDEWGGGNFAERLQLFINYTVFTSCSVQLRVEIVVVEYNPPKDRPRLEDAWGWPRLLTLPFNASIRL